MALFSRLDVRIVLEGTKWENVRAILNENVLFCHPYEDHQEGMPKDYVPPPKIDNVTAAKEMIRLGRIMPLVNLLGKKACQHKTKGGGTMVYWWYIGAIETDGRTG